jgi:hypothetical protein
MVRKGGPPMFEGGKSSWPVGVEDEEDRIGTTEEGRG